MSDAQRRAVRSLFQVGLVTGLMALYNAFATPEYQLTTTQQGAIITVAIPLVSFVQNFLEDRGSIPALLKAPASSGADPVPDDGGHP